MPNCFFCKSDFQYDLQIYDGFSVKGYDLTACRRCYEANWDGWNPQHEEKLLEHLRGRNISIPQRNAKGWFPREILEHTSL